MLRPTVRSAAFFCMAGLGILGSAGSGWAQVLVTSRAALGADTYIDWGSLGRPTNSSVSNPFTIDTASNFGNTVSKPTGSFTFFIQGGPGQDFNNGGYWGGNFTAGDNLLNTSFNDSGPLRIAFKNPVAGAGAQIQSNGAGNFTARITAFDSGGLQLSFATENGIANGKKDGSAVFLGLEGTTANIASIQFSLDSFPSTGQSDFTINRVDLATTGVPEPSSLALLGMTGLGLLGVARRRLGGLARLWRGETDSRS